MSDLLERLREVEDWNYGALLHEAADEIERLRGRVKELESCMETPRAEDLAEIERLELQVAELELALDFAEGG